MEAIRAVSFVKIPRRDRHVILELILSEHTYAKPISLHPDYNRIHSAKVLQFLREDSETVPPKDEAEDDVDIDIETIQPAPESRIGYDGSKAKSMMTEIERCFNALKQDGTFSDDEQISRTGWTKEQGKLFDQVYRTLSTYQIARYTYEQHPNEPVLRRIALDKATRRVRSSFATVSWDVKFTSWLHSTLLDGLSSSMFLCYLEVLQTLKAKVPSLVERMIEFSSPNEEKKELLNSPSLVNCLKKSWDPSVGLSIKTNQLSNVQCEQTPFLLIVPNGPTVVTGSSKRYKFWHTQLSAIGKVVPVNMHTSRTGSEFAVKQFLENMISAVRTKIKEFRNHFQERPIILVGWSVGALVACQVAQSKLLLVAQCSPVIRAVKQVAHKTHVSLLEELTGVVCLGFPCYGLRGPREDDTDPFLEMRCPVMYVVGTHASSCPIEHLETLREKMKVNTELLLVEGAEEMLKLPSSYKRRIGLTQNMIDRLIVDEISMFIGKVSSPEKHEELTKPEMPPPTPQEIKIPKKRKYTKKTKENGVEKKKPKLSLKLMKPGTAAAKKVNAKTEVAPGPPTEEKPESSEKATPQIPSTDETQKAVEPNAEQHKQMQTPPVITDSSLSSPNSIVAALKTPIPRLPQKRPASGKAVDKPAKKAKISRRPLIQTTKPHATSAFAKVTQPGMIALQRFVPGQSILLSGSAPVQLHGGTSILYVPGSSGPAPVFQTIGNRAVSLAPSRTPLAITTTGLTPAVITTTGVTSISIASSMLSTSGIQVFDTVTTNNTSVTSSNSSVTPPTLPATLPPTSSVITSLPAKPIPSISATSTHSTVTSVSPVTSATSTTTISAPVPTTLTASLTNSDFRYLSKLIKDNQEGSPVQSSAHEKSPPGPMNPISTRIGIGTLSALAATEGSPPGSGLKAPTSVSPGSGSKPVTSMKSVMSKTSVTSSRPTNVAVSESSDKTKAKEVGQKATLQTLGNQTHRKVDGAVKRTHPKGKSAIRSVMLGTSTNFSGIQPSSSQSHQHQQQHIRVSGSQSSVNKPQQQQIHLPGAPNSGGQSHIPVTFTIPISNLQGHITLTSTLSKGATSIVSTPKPLTSVPTLSSIGNQQKLILSTTSVNSGRMLNQQPSTNKASVVKQPAATSSAVGNRIIRSVSVPSSIANSSPARVTVKSRQVSTGLTNVGKTPATITLHIPSSAVLNDPKLLKGGGSSEIKLIGLLNTKGSRSPLSSPVHFSVQSRSAPASPLGSPQGVNLSKSLSSASTTLSTKTPSSFQLPQTSISKQTETLAAGPEKLENKMEPKDLDKEVEQMEDPEEPVKEAEKVTFTKEADKEAEHVTGITKDKTADVSSEMNIDICTLSHDPCPTEFSLIDLNKVASGNDSTKGDEASSILSNDKDNQNVQMPSGSHKDVFFGSLAESSNRYHAGIEISQEGTDRKAALDVSKSAEETKIDKRNEIYDLSKHDDANQAVEALQKTEQVSITTELPEKQQGKDLKGNQSVDSFKKTDYVASTTKLPEKQQKKALKGAQGVDSLQKAEHIASTTKVPEKQQGKALKRDQSVDSHLEATHSAAKVVKTSIKESAGLTKDARNLKGRTHVIQRSISENAEDIVKRSTKGSTVVVGDVKDVKKGTEMSQRRKSDSEIHSNGGPIKTKAKLKNEKDVEKKPVDSSSRKPLRTPEAKFVQALETKVYQSSRNTTPMPNLKPLEKLGISEKLKSKSIAEISNLSKEMTIKSRGIVGQLLVASRNSINKDQNKKSECDNEDNGTVNKGPIATTSESSASSSDEVSVLAPSQEEMGWTSKSDGSHDDKNFETNEKNGVKERPSGAGDISPSSDPGKKGGISARKLKRLELLLEAASNEVGDLSERETRSRRTSGPPREKKVGQSSSPLGSPRGRKPEQLSTSSPASPRGRRSSQSSTSLGSPRDRKQAPSSIGVGKMTAETPRKGRRSVEMLLEAAKQVDNDGKEELRSPSSRSLRSSRAMTEHSYTRKRLPTPRKTEE